MFIVFKKEKTKDIMNKREKRKVKENTVKRRKNNISINVTYLINN